MRIRVQGEGFDRRQQGSNEHASRALSHGATIQKALKAESNFVVSGSVLKLEVQVRRLYDCCSKAYRILGAQQTRRPTAGDRAVPVGQASAVLLLRHDAPRREPRRSDSEHPKVLGVDASARWHPDPLLPEAAPRGGLHTQRRQTGRRAPCLDMIMFSVLCLQANMAIGRGKQAQMMFILDFGLAREFVTRNGDKPAIRRARKHVLFRCAFATRDF